ncbi:MAG: acyl-CoA dehydrogenase, partial [Mycobacterium sp.]
MPDISEAQFSAEAHAFLETNAKRREDQQEQKWGEGSDAVVEKKTREDELNDVRLAMAWRQKKFDAGFGWVGGPAQYGGRGLPAAWQRIYDGLEAQYEAPAQNCFIIGLGMVAP